ncbi:MAG: hypothetical protein EHM61_25375, partial [Acidobacteria bacterium]
MRIPFRKRDGAPAGPQPTMNRRHILKFLGGSALGTVLTPLPWKVLDDVAIWTQNWSWIPVPPKGETIIRYTTCRLCPAGCGVRARCIGSQPVSLTGLPGHPGSRGFLCPGGLVGHHSPYSPERFTRPLRVVGTSGRREVSQVSADQVFKDLGDALIQLKSHPTEGRVAILDTMPGRSTSLAYRLFLSNFADGTYIAPDDQLQKPLSVFKGIAGQDYPEFGLDIEHARTIVSFGADLEESWRLSQQVSDPAPRVIQIGARYSKSAALADSWLPVTPGSEPILALSLAGVILKERRFHPSVASLVEQMQAMPDVNALLSRVTPDRAAQACGISSEEIVAAAREMTAFLPCVAVTAGDQGGVPLTDSGYTAVNLLNVLTGSVGSVGGLVPRRELPLPVLPAGNPVPVTGLSDVPDGSIRLLMIDGSSLSHSTPSSLLRRKLADKSVVASFAGFPGGYADVSDYVLPIPVYLEALDEVPTAPDSCVAAFSLSLPLLSPPDGGVSPFECLNRLAQTTGMEWTLPAVGTLIDSRIKAIWETRRGSVYSYSGGGTKPSTEIASPEELAKVLKEGALWQDAPTEGADVRLAESAFMKAETWRKLKTGVEPAIEIAANRSADSLTLVPFSTPFMATMVSPLTGKLTRESDLYPRSGDAFVNP